MVRPHGQNDDTRRPPQPSRAGSRPSRTTWRGEFVLALVLTGLAIVILRPVLGGSPTVVPAAAAGEEAPAEATPTEKAQGEGPVDSTTKEPVTFESTGELAIVPGTEEPSGPRPVRTFTVQIENGVPIEPSEFAGTVTSVLSSPRSWGGLEGFSVQRVDDPEADFHVILATPDTTDKLCKPLDTDGIYSCQRHNRAILNAWRWFEGADAYGKDLGSYRIYMVNHEVGHVWLHPHLSCPESGTLAPVMVQQTVAVAPCKPNPWPLESEAHE